jgi:hypothetical protein
VVRFVVIAIIVITVLVLLYIYGVGDQFLTN